MEGGPKGPWSWSSIIFEADLKLAIWSYPLPKINMSPTKKRPFQRGRLLTSSSSHHDFRGRGAVSFREFFGRLPRLAVCFCFYRITMNSSESLIGFIAPWFTWVAIIRVLVTYWAVIISLLLGYGMKYYSMLYIFGDDFHMPLNQKSGSRS